MGRYALKLRVPPPYDGESLSSFLGRAAQHYHMPLRYLLADLGWVNENKKKPDWDLAPNEVVHSRLGDVVQNWHSPVNSHQGFRYWILGRYHRTAYCVECFKEDLAEGRTPYFRADWIAALVTSCWKHSIPLCNWLDVSADGCRRLPMEWVEEKFDVSMAPTFFHAHQKQLDALSREDSASASIRDALKNLYLFQRLMEKRAEEELPPEDAPELINERLRVFGEEEVLRTMRFWRNLIVRGKRPAVGDRHYAPWFEPHIQFPDHSTGRYLPTAIRRAGNLMWRRSYFHFAAEWITSLDAERKQWWKVEHGLRIAPISQELGVASA